MLVAWAARPIYVPHELGLAADYYLVGLAADGEALESTPQPVEGGDSSLPPSGGVRELEDTLRDLGEAAQAIRDLAETLERDPDMLLKGRAPTVKP